MDYLYHYYERAGGPFRNLSDLPLAQSREILAHLRRQGNVFAAQRAEGYLERRRELEQLVRARFVAKGGAPLRAVPHYLVWGTAPWLATWYAEPACVRIALANLDERSISFTYGDMFPTFSPRVQDGKEYRNQVYTLTEMRELIQRYGLPQEWNANGELGPERYIEAHLWSDLPAYELVD